MILRDYQQQGIDEIRAAFAAGCDKPLYVGATGSGKTVMFTYISKHVAEKGKRVCIIVHRKELLTQTVAALDYDCGCIKAGMRECDHAIQVASVSTLVNRIQKKDYGFDLLIIDECHHAKAAMYLKILDAFPKAKVLGVTATPIRLDGKGLGDIFDVLIEGPSVAHLTAQGYLAPATIYAPTVPTMKGVRTVRGDFDKKQLMDLMGNPKITGCAIDHYKRLADGLPTIVFCVSVQHSKDVAAVFCAAGYNAVHVDGATPDAERKDALDGLARGRITHVCNCELFGEGVDVPVVACGIMLRPTQSLSLSLQQLGRILRPYPGKKEAIIIDHAGNVLRHGLPDMDRDWKLETTKVKAKDIEKVNLRQCKNCFAVHKPAPVCPYCGYVYEVESREIEEVEGELVKVDKARLDAIHRTEVRQARTREALMEIAKRRGHKPGWVWHVMQARKTKGVAVK